MLSLASVNSEETHVARTRGAIGTKTALARIKQQPALDADAARRVAAAFLHERSKRSGINMSQFTAQLHEIRCVETLVGFASDDTLPEPFRAQCCKDVIELARGKPKVWLHDTATINPAAPSLRDPEHRTVADDIAEVKTMSACYEELNALVSAGVHTNDWPDRVRDLVDAATLESFNVVPTGTVN
jgi:hypothetical protein